MTPCGTQRPLLRPGTGGLAGLSSCPGLRSRHRAGQWFMPLSLRGLSCPGNGRVRGLRRPLLRLCVQWEALSAQSWVLAENQPRVQGGGREAHLESAGTIVKITNLVNMYRAPPVCKALCRLASALREPVQSGRQSSSYHKNK